MGIDYYTLLGISKNANDTEIKKAFRKKALQEHPDKGGDAEKFKEINKAYSVLSDPKKKSLYDQFGEHGLEGMDNNPFAGAENMFPEDLFNMMGGNFFGGAQKRRRTKKKHKSKDDIIEIELSLEEIFSGTEFVIQRKRRMFNEKDVECCKECDGDGVKVKVVRNGFMQFSSQETCSRCDGLGKYIHPSKYFHKNVELKVKIPAGVEEGHQVIFKNMTDDIPNVIPGNVIYVVKYKPHKLFKLKDQDLFYEVNISLYEALIGGKRYIKFLDKKNLELSFEKIKPNDIKTIKGKGLTSRNHLHVKFNIDFPEQISNKYELELSKILNQKRKMYNVTDTNIHKCELQDYCESNFKNYSHNRHNSTNNENEEHVQCAQS